MENTKYKNTHNIALLALLFSIISIVAVTMLYTNLEKKVVELTEQATTQMNQNENIVPMDIDDLVQNTQDIIERVESGEVTDEVRSDIAQLRASANELYQEADSEAQESLDVVNENLMDAEEALSSNTVQAIDSLQNALEELEKMIQ